MKKWWVLVGGGRWMIGFCRILNNKVLVVDVFFCVLLVFWIQSHWVKYTTVNDHSCSFRDPQKVGDLCYSN